MKWWNPIPDSVAEMKKTLALREELLREERRTRCRTCGAGPLAVYWITRHGCRYCPRHRPKTAKRVRIPRPVRILVGITDRLIAKG